MLVTLDLRTYIAIMWLQSEIAAFNRRAIFLMKLQNFEYDWTECMYVWTN